MTPSSSTRPRPQLPKGAPSPAQTTRLVCPSVSCTYAPKTGFHTPKHVLTRLTAAGYYTNDNSMNHGAGYPVHAQTSNNYSFGMSNGSSSYGPVYYGSAQAAGDYALTESRKRGHDALNEFFGDAKRRLIDANTYQDLGARFGGLASLGLPVGNDYAAGYTGRANDYTTATVYQASMPAAPVNYTLPFSELKTKHDLMSIDQFLEQLQNTVYEHPDQAAASGYAHPGLHQQSTGMYGQRQSLSPGYATHQSSTPGARSSVSLAPSNLDDGTPALTPASYNSTHSPVSAHSHPSAVSPAPRPTGSMYPTLPSLNEMQQFGYSSGAPASGLANAYDDLDSRRRYSGGFLQRAQPARRSSPPQSTDNLSRRSSTDAGLSKGVRNVDLSSPKPAAAAPPTYRRRNTGSSDGSSAASADGRSEAWVQNVRIIEALRDFVRARLEKGEFDDDAAAAAASREHAASSSAASPSSPSQAAAAEERRSATPTQAQPHPQQQQQETDTEMGEAREQKPGGSLYPILRAVEATS